MQDQLKGKSRRQVLNRGKISNVHQRQESPMYAKRDMYNKAAVGMDEK